MHYILYNTLSGNKKGLESARRLVGDLVPESTALVDVMSIASYADFWKDIDLENDTVILSGGDGTLNRFINQNAGLVLPKKLFYYASGSGNDFRNDAADEKDPLVPLNKYIADLPTVTVNGKTAYFINGIGYGIDGYCCEVGDKQKEKSNKPVNYTAIAIKGVLFHFKHRRAKITVDGVTREYKRVWIAPTMKGRFYGGGMMVAPTQNRFDSDGKVSVGIFHNASALKLLTILPSVFEGKHIKHTKQFEMHQGHEVTVEFDRPTSLQIDGETVLGVTSYTVKTGKTANRMECAAAEV
jgi:diacylglycerol kinase family enzyme